MCTLVSSRKSAVEYSSHNRNHNHNNSIGTQPAVLYGTGQQDKRTGRTRSNPIKAPSTSTFAMPKHNAIRTLAEHALAELAKIIVHTIGGNEALDEDLATVIITSYLSEGGATSNIYQDLLRGILCSDSLEASIRFGCLRALLTEGVQSLVTEIFPFSYYEKILKVIAEQGSGLRYLNLKGVWVKDEQMNYMFDIVNRLKDQLTILSIPYIANDDLLEEIGKTCR